MLISSPVRTQLFLTMVFFPPKTISGFLSPLHMICSYENRTSTQSKGLNFIPQAVYEISAAPQTFSAHIKIVCCGQGFKLI